MRRVAGSLIVMALFSGVLMAEEGDFLSKLDTNGNGIIEPGEVPERMRKLIDGAAKHVGLDPSGPLPLDKLRGKKESSSSTSSSSGSGAPADSSSRPASESGGSSSKSSDQSAATRFGSSSAKPDKPLVPGFGEDPKLPAVPGFDKPGGSSTGGRSGGGSGSGGDRSDDDDRGSDEPGEKLRRYAEGLMRQYDENKNGRLEKDEWRRMRGDPNAADKNRDGIITIEELTDRLASYSRRRSSSSSDSRDSRDDRGDRSDQRASSSDERPLRFLTPIERLPKGLPDWFLRSDQDGDAQVMMHEFSSSLTDSKVAEFFQYDHNRDGIITPAEALAGEGKSSSTASSSSSSGSSSSSSSSRYGSSRGYGRRP